MLKALLRAIVAGTIAGTTFPTIVLTLAIFGSSGSAVDLRSGIGISLATVLMPLALVALSAVILGIPATFVLRRMCWENEPAYIFVGGTLGFLVPDAIMAVTESDATMIVRALPLGILGAFSGAMTARSWWRSYREEQVDGR